MVLGPFHVESHSASESAVAANSLRSARETVPTTAGRRPSLSSRDVFDTEHEDRRRAHVERPEQICALAESKLRNSGYDALRYIQCSVEERMLVLDGCVSTFHLKQVAQTTVKDVVARYSSVLRIDNRIEVLTRSPK